MNILERIEVEMLEYHRRQGKPCSTLILSCNIIENMTIDLQPIFGNIPRLHKDYILHTEYFDCCYKGKKIVRVIENDIISVI